MHLDYTYVSLLQKSIFLTEISPLIEDIDFLLPFNMFSFILIEHFLMQWEFRLLQDTVLGMIKYLVRGDWMAQRTGNGIDRAFHP